MAEKVDTVPTPVPVPLAPSAAGMAPPSEHSAWEQALDSEVHALLASGQGEVWDRLMHRFESRLIRAALGTTHGRRMEAAQRLGIGRNTITRKIQELGLDAPDDGKNGF